MLTYYSSMVLLQLAERSRQCPGHLCPCMDCPLVRVEFKRSKERGNNVKLGIQVMASSTFDLLRAYLAAVPDKPTSESNPRTKF